MTDKPKNPPGRPAIVRGEPSTPVTVRMSSHDYDAAWAEARRNGTSVPAVVRRALGRYLGDDEND